MTIKTIMLAGVAGAALLAPMPFSPEPVYAQNNTYVAPDEGQSSDDQSSREMKKRQVQSDDQSSREMKKQRQGQSDEQSSREMKKQRQGQSDEQSSSREMKKDGKEAMANGRRMDRDRHGQRMRHREGRFRHYHEGYYYATPWWTTGIVVDGGGIGCRDGARIVSRRGFNRVSAISCGGETYSYRGWRGGDPWRIRIDSDTGRIVSVRPAG
jgi:hypothetical protein